MNGEAIKELVTGLRKPVQMGDFIVRPSDWLVTDPASAITPGPSAKTLPVSTLGAVRDYLHANRDALDLTHVVVHVVSPALVQVLGPLDPRSRTRELYLSASALDLTDGFLTKYLSLEDLVIGLQVRFVDADDRKRLLALLGNVKHESVRTAVDDGVTQVVQARSGVVLVSDVAVPNPVTLCAYRTFRDIVQPSSVYVVRVKGHEDGDLPEAALFEADGGAWRLTAIARIHDWLIEAVPDVAILA